MWLKDFLSCSSHTTPPSGGPLPLPTPEDNLLPLVLPLEEAKGPALQGGSVGCRGELCYAMSGVRISVPFHMQKGLDTWFRFHEPAK